MTTSSTATLSPRPRRPVGPSVPPRTAAPRQAGDTGLAYQPALDGLRTVAVVSVILYHNGVSWMPGGFLGVDVFFVLSGYLITTLLMLEVDRTGGINLRAFWLRRVRRLFPALLLVLGVIAAYGAFAADPITLHRLRWDSLASLAYVANWRFVFSHQSYFEGFLTPSPLRHLWSLAVEEQWYLFWPIFVTVGLRVTRFDVKRLLVPMAALTALSVGLMAWITRGSGDPSRAYYGTDTRASTLLVGAMLAVVLHEWPMTRKRRRARMALQMAGTCGLLAVAGFLVLVHETDRFMYRGGFLALAVATAAVIGAAMLSVEGPAKRFLRLRPLPAIGRLSYGLYLWHWPVNVWLTPERLHLDGPITVGSVPVGGYLLVAARIGVTALVSLASYVAVELPVRRRVLARFGRRIQRPRLVPSLATGSAMALAAALVVVATNGASSTPSAGARLIPAGAGAQGVGVPKGQRALAAATTVPIPPVGLQPPLPPVPSDRPVRLMVAGDSAAWSLAWLIGQPTPDTEATDFGLIGCGVMDTPYYVHSQMAHFPDSCTGWQQHWQQGASGRTPDGRVVPKPDVATIMVGAWEVYDHQIDGKREKPTSAAFERKLTDELSQAIDLVRAVDPDVRLAFLQMACLRERDDRLGGTTSERNDPARLQHINAVVKRLAARYGDRAIVIDMNPFLCPGGKFRETAEGEELRPDGAHFTKPSALVVWKWLAPQLVGFARRPTA